MALALRWAALAGLYLALVGIAPSSELIAALLASLAGAAFSILLRRSAEPAAHVRAPWARLLVRLAGAILRDVWRVGLALTRAIVLRHTGRHASLRIRRAGEGGAEQEHRALVILLASAAPNTYVLGLRRGTLVVHRLAPAAPPPDRQWPV